MIQKTIEYEDYNGVKRKETFLFNLTKTELTEMQWSTLGGLKENMERIIEAQNTPELIKIFKGLLFKAYGEKSLDGRRIIKSEELSIAFSQTPAYDKLYMELATNSKSAAAFMNGIVPAGLAEEVAKMEKEAAEEVPTAVNVSLLGSN